MGPEITVSLSAFHTQPWTLTSLYLERQTNILFNTSFASLGFCFLQMYSIQYQFLEHFTLHSSRVWLWVRVKCSRSMAKHGVGRELRFCRQCFWVEPITVWFERRVTARVTWLPAPPSTLTQMSGRSPFISSYVILDMFHNYFSLLFLTCKMSPLIRSIKSVECCCCYF